MTKENSKSKGKPLQNSSISGAFSESKTLNSYRFVRNTWITVRFRALTTDKGRCGDDGGKGTNRKGLKRSTMEALYDDNFQAIWCRFARLQIVTVGS